MLLIWARKELVKSHRSRDNIDTPHLKLLSMCPVIAGGITNGAILDIGSLDAPENHRT